MKTTHLNIRYVLITCLLFLVFSTYPTTAKTYYVNSAGNNLNSGLDTNHAWQSTDRLTRNIFAGDTVRFKGGDTIRGNCIVYDSYTINSLKTVFYSYGNGKATLIDTGVVFTIPFLNIAKYEFNNLIFTNSSIGIYVYNSIPLGHTYYDSTYFVISNCEFYNLKDIGINLDVMSYYKRGYYRITNNIFNNIINSAISIAGICYSDVLISNNTITNIPGIETADYNTGISMRWCRNISVQNNSVSGIGKNVRTGSAGIYSTGSRGIRISYNFVSNIFRNGITEGNGIYLDCGSDSCLIDWNTIDSCQGNCLTLANAPTSFCGYPNPNMPGFVEDTLESSYNTAQYNTLRSIGRGGVQMFAGYIIPYSNPVKKYTNPQFRNIVFSNWFYVINGIGITQTGNSQGLYISKNTFLLDSSTAIKYDNLINPFIYKNTYWNIGDGNYTAQYYNQKYTSALQWYTRTGIGKQ